VINHAVQLSTQIRGPTLCKFRVLEQSMRSDNLAKYKVTIYTGVKTHDIDLVRNMKESLSSDRRNEMCYR